MPGKTDLIIPARAIANAAQALWGTRWQSDMARALSLDLRRVQRIAAAARDDRTYHLPPAVLERLLHELERVHLPMQRAYEDLKLFYEGGR